LRSRGEQEHRGHGCGDGGQGWHGAEPTAARASEGVHADGKGNGVGRSPDERHARPEARLPRAPP
jgi:hypothetical protein